ncbi:hypothetical protein OHS33_21280 [Streptomyces sp. NBC_00536]|uniref:hypothetical protein n=1 Tax=Streptomyces sp. NBC_00536 TaxID=2975769 RepID=UPI002E809FAB|nr:hypothetical protein [Streptomyces sp. NBC_00536]WUC80629.1 hypothetical protein OHS33_21280 [Streptomyces sp. NBC_00536]
MRRRLVTLAMLGSALTMGLGAAGTGVASASTPTAAPVGIQYVSPEKCTGSGGKIVFHYIFLGCSGGTYDGYRIG